VSIKKMLLDTVRTIEDSVGSNDPESLRKALSTVAIRLETMAEMLPEESPQRHFDSNTMIGPGLLDGSVPGVPESVQKAILRQQNRLQEISPQVRREESSGGLYEFVGGPMDGTYSPVNGSPPVGARVQLGQTVYEMRNDSRFHALIS